MGRHRHLLKELAFACHRAVSSYWTRHQLALACIVVVPIQCLPVEAGAAHEARFLSTVNKLDHIQSAVVPGTSLPLPHGLDTATPRHCRSITPAAGIASTSRPAALAVSALLHHSRSSQRCSSICSSPIRCVADAQPAAAPGDAGAGSAPAWAAQAGPAEPCRPWRRQPGEWCGRGRHGHNQWRHQVGSVCS